jgi:hypothetical protein
MSGAPSLRQRPHLLDRVEYGSAFARAKGLAQQLAQQAHVVSKRLVRVHGVRASNLPAILVFLRN